MSAALVATALGGVAIPAGSPLLLLLGAANHDPNAFEHPELFDLHRTDANGHLSFGWGKHYCLGAPLAKLEVAVVLEMLAGRLPKARPEADATLSGTDSFEGLADCPPPLRECVRRATALDPGERYVSARDMREALLPMAERSAPPRGGGGSRRGSCG